MMGKLVSAGEAVEDQPDVVEHQRVSYHIGFLCSLARDDRDAWYENVDRPNPTMGPQITQVACESELQRTSLF
jgi:hypothetical protein